MSIIFLIAFLIIVNYNFTDDGNLYQLLNELINFPLGILLIMTLPFICIIPTLVYQNARTILFPTLLEKIETVLIYLNSKNKFSRLEHYFDKLESLYKSNDIIKSSLEFEEFDINKLTLNFTSKCVERIYRENFIFENIRILKIIISIM